MDATLESETNLLKTSLDRRQLLRSGGIAGIGLIGASLLAGCGGSGNSSGSSSTDQQILNAAATAEALATTMYYNIVNVSGSIYKVGLAGNAPDQAYMVAGYEEELNHYNFLVNAGAKPLATTFYFPTNMFVDPQTTVNTLVTLEDAFIAAYLIGVRDFSSTALKVIAAQIMGIEAEHRVLARVVTNDLGLTSVTGLSGVAEAVNAPGATANNLAYERTFSTALPDISHVVTALGPFVSLAWNHRLLDDRLHILNGGKRGSVGRADSRHLGQHRALGLLRKDAQKLVVAKVKVMGKLSRL
jgi:hypothetical protein